MENKKLKKIKKELKRIKDEILYRHKLNYPEDSSNVETHDFLLTLIIELQYRVEKLENKVKGNKKMEECKK